MVRILNIDCSSNTLYISIAENGKLLTEKTDIVQRNHASNLQPFVEEILQACSIGFSDLHAVAVMNGPGSYTGLRVGLSAAKGYCFALDIPLICISNLEAIAHQYYDENQDFKQNITSIISPMKDEVIIEEYNSNLMLVTPAKHITLKNNNNNYFIDTLNIIGCVSNDIVSTFKIANFYYQLYKNMYINSLSFSLYQKSRFNDIIDAEPNYLKKTFIN